MHFYRTSENTVVLELRSRCQTKLAFFSVGPMQCQSAMNEVTKAHVYPVHMPSSSVSKSPCAFGITIKSSILQSLV